ncbi:hypothetical protein OVS_01500 [Mycoplasma ovis str. Michigan]|uniref:Uncharacterized protein n=1 Tax=Mycoplasma ovis str. Michigan TaxID=1415773 RepID=A0ABN4BMV7_9MOLU|nr:hypothetical protein [Mycoplasma ovis]AHC40207.1 hypothetical protein OVS_01500 [Mycoplasma ovis str. Michigan]
MILALKALIGVAVTGMGAIVPMAIKQAGGDIGVTQQVAEFLRGSKTLQEIQKQVAENKALSKKHANISLALGTLSVKKCQLMQNHKNPNNWFNSLYGCKLDDNKFEFYYLGSEHSIANADSSSLIKKVTSVDYQRSWNWDGSDAHLQLTLEDGSKVDWLIFANSGWEYFKNVKLEDSCKIVTPMAGRDLLRCELKDSKDGSSFVYAFSIF